MGKISTPVKIISTSIVLVGAFLLAFNIYTGGTLNVALPLLFLILGGAFFILVFRFQKKWDRASILYIPGSLLLAFGVIFLLNVLTNDWKSWAYAWLLLVAAAGIGLLLAQQDAPWHPAALWAGWGMAVLGITFFAVFGAIAGGLFIQVIAPILLIAAGLSLRFLYTESLFPAPFLKKLHPASRAAGGDPQGSEPIQLVEPLSSRELEVLRWIDEGLSNQQIADKLTVAVSTVKTHINNIYGKLGVQTRTQAVRRARELNLFDSK
jgi:DNA-binding CsgD family transcriptional regulator